MLAKKALLMLYAAFFMVLSAVPRGDFAQLLGLQTAFSHYYEHFPEDQAQGLRLAHVAQFICMHYHHAHDKNDQTHEKLPFLGGQSSFVFIFYPHEQVILKYKKPLVFASQKLEHISFYSQKLSDLHMLNLLNPPRLLHAA